MDRLEAINFISEQRSIKSLMKETGRRLNFKGQVATSTNFAKILEENPRILHISCHGLKLNLKHRTMQLDSAKEDKENCLIFET